MIKRDGIHNPTLLDVEQDEFLAADVIDYMRALISDHESQSQRGEECSR